MSKASVVDSVACKREYQYAAALQKPILPVLVADDVSTSLLPSELQKIQFVDYKLRDINSIKSLARALGHCHSATSFQTLCRQLPSPRFPIWQASAIKLISPHFWILRPKAAF